MILLPCLQVSPPDQEDAVDLCALIAEHSYAEPSRDFWIIYRRDCDQGLIQHATKLLNDSFRAVAIQARNYGEGHPDGCNALWTSAMIESWHMTREGRAMHEAILTFEADCVPLRPDWIDVLENEWIKNRPAQVVGHQDENHINGNAMFGATLLRDQPMVLQNSSNGNWDWANRFLFNKIGKNTDMIFQLYQQKTIEEDQFIRILKNGTRPALLHGVKDSSARRLAERHIIPPALIYAQS
jgi:hypothetical protein